MRLAALLTASVLCSSSAFSASLPISGLAARGTPSATDVLPLQVAGSTSVQKVTMASLAAYALNSVKAYGAVGDGSTDDTAAFSSAITAACALATAGPSGAATVIIPPPSVSYVVSSTLTLSCASLHIQGQGYPVINYTGTSGALFLNPNQYNIEIDHLYLKGTNAAGVWGIRNYAVSSTGLNTHYHDLFISNFGDGTAPNGTGGGCMTIDSDTQRLTVRNVVFSCKTVDFNETGASDVADISDNVFASQNGTGPVRGVNVYNQLGGPATQALTHNAFEAEGYGALTINNPASGAWIVRDNESETLLAFTNTTGASFEFIAGAQFQVTGNTSNPHGYGTYDYYVGDAVVNSNFNYDFGGAASAGAGHYTFRVGSGVGNTYYADQSNSGPGTVYSGDYPGIMLARSSSASGWSVGCANPLVLGNEICGKTQVYLPSITTSDLGFSEFAPNLATSNALFMAFGHDNTTNNGANLIFNYVGAGSASNTLQIGLLNGVAVTVTATGNLAASSLTTTALTVATLPASPANGQRSFVTDATACTFNTAVTGGGAVKCPVVYNGAWVAG